MKSLRGKVEITDDIYMNVMRGISSAGVIKDTIISFKTDDPNIFYVGMRDR